LLLHCASVQADLVIISVTHSLNAAATGGAPDMDFSTGGDNYLNTVTSSGTSPAGDVNSLASQVASHPAVDPTMSGRGTVRSTADLTGATGFSAAADSVFDATFTVDVAGLYALTADVAWAGTSPPYGGVAVFSLEDAAMNDLALIMRSFAVQGADSIATVVSLSPGTTYHLFARALVEGGGDPGAGAYGADASWEFELVAVPEAGCVLVMSPLAIIAAWSAWRSRRAARA
jgi:hypothetical protein